MEENKNSNVQEPQLEVLNEKQNENCFTPIFLMPIEVKIKVECELKRRAENDEQLAECLKKESKNWADCTKYIEGRIFQSIMAVAKDYQGLQKMMTDVEGSSTRVLDKWFADEQIYQLAEYYYKDDSIEREKARKTEIEKRHKGEQKAKAKENKPTKPTKSDSEPENKQSAQPAKPNKTENKAEENQPRQLSLF